MHVSTAVVCVLAKYIAAKYGRVKLISMLIDTYGVSPNSQVNINVNNSQSCLKFYHDNVVVNVRLKMVHMPYTVLLNVDILKLS